MNALILHAGALGDCVLALHVAMAIGRKGHRVTVAARSPIARWAAKRGLIDEAISLDRLSPMLWGAKTDSDGRHTDLVSFIANSDHVISFLGGPDEEVAARLAELFGANLVIHIDPRPTDNSVREGTHITQQWVESINRQGLHFKLEISDPKFELSNLNADLLLHSSKDISTSPHRHFTLSPHVLVHPGSGGRAKCCPLEHLESLMAELLSRNLNAQWMMGPDEVERDGDEFRQRLERTAPVILKESVEAAADRVAAANAFIGNDAGMTHVAALAGINTVALFGPTDPRVWRPLGPNCTVVPFPSEQEPKFKWIAEVVRALATNP